jgi:hypothetical protein
MGEKRKPRKVSGSNGHPCSQVLLPSSLGNSVVERAGTHQTVRVTEPNRNGSVPAGGATADQSPQHGGEREQLPPSDGGLDSVYERGQNDYLQIVRAMADSCDARSRMELPTALGTKAPQLYHKLSV